LDPEYKKDAEIASLLKGLNFIMGNVENYSFYYRDTTGVVPLTAVSFNVSRSQ